MTVIRHLIGKARRLLAGCARMRRPEAKKTSQSGAAFQRFLLEFKSRNIVDRHGTKRRSG